MRSPGGSTPRSSDRNLALLPQDLAGAPAAHGGARRRRCAEHLENRQLRRWHHGCKEKRMNELLAILMSWAATLAGYSRPITPPEIVMVPHSYLVAEACGGRECRVLGWYARGQRIFLDERLDPESSLFASSIVVHEMVHYLQQQSGRFEEGFSCDSALAREREAYAVQREFLLRSGAFQPVGASMHAVGCAP
jgi:hypothetical protein